MYSTGLPYLIITVSNRPVSIQPTGYVVGTFLVNLKF